MADRVTMKDVARAAGVSPATVSFVLNRTAGQTISPRTSERVRDAAHRLGYTPHRIARALREGSSRTVVLTTGPLPGGHSLESFIAGLDDELRSLGYALLVVRGEQAADLVEAVSPRAVIDLASAYEQRGAPWEGGWASGLASHGEAQLRHLVGRGHRHIAFAMPSQVLPTLTGVRFALARQAAGRLALPPVRPLALGEDRHASAASVRELRATHPDVTAIAAFDDDTALLVLAGMADTGLAAPDDLAVIGFDDSRHAALWRPALTTVRIDAASYGRRAARRALGLPGDDPQPRASVVVERETT
ncbi:LacI family DNA-binding transcriptional regulator [Microbacterium marinilacus]|uniref:LacI family DNA-binding transcriptional regulator n=1 Tax=Microbacterium marinilacus TaxID=415209 RepID=A0ABP7BFX8_9MICO|nr:LacI family DNA-binding transcriptional regulator [Microbacterium marinilacus]MBY0689000.1 LacI family transcriptional regulator [Microbacterium marinilacus]